MKAARRWSLSRRMTLWFVAITTSLVLVICSLSAWYLQQSTERELRALLHEEMDELEALLEGSAATEATLESITARLALQHPENPLGWRFWQAGSGDPWDEFGRVELLEHAPHSPDGLGSVLDLGSGVRWLAAPMGAELVAGLALDGRAQLAILRRYGLLALTLAAVSAVAASGAGALYARRVSLVLRHVADSARAIPRESEEFQPPPRQAPEEIREVVEALDAMLGNIRKAERNSRLIVAGLAHELRSPIQNLIGETEVTLLNERDAAEYRRVLESRLDELRDLGRVIDNLVLLCAPRETTSSPKLETFDLGREADLRLIREQARASRDGVILDVETRGDLRLRGDREGVLLALGNLVSNAVKWTPAGGSVAVALDGTGDSVSIVVDDQGPGVPPPERDRIFEAFYVGPSSNGRRAGYGLGLALARSAVEAHGGRIEVGDAPGGGARFRVVLPRRSQPSAAPTT